MKTRIQMMVQMMTQTKTLRLKWGTRTKENTNIRCIPFLCLLNTIVW